MIPWTEKLDLKMGDRDERISLPVKGALPAATLAQPLPAPNGLQQAARAMLRYWKLIALVAAVCLLLGLAMLMLTRPQYEANALVQVEMAEETPSKVFSAELAEMTGHQTAVSAEVELLKSRLVLDTVVDKLRLDLSVTPRMLPLIGSLVAAVRGSKGELWEAPAFLQGYAWGGEHLQLTSLVAPEAWGEGVLSLRVVDAATYELLVLGNDAPILTGVVGTPASVTLPEGEVSIDVAELGANPGTIFDITVQPRAEVMADLLMDYRATEQGKDSGLIKVTYRSTDPVQATSVVNLAIEEYRRQDVSWRVNKASQTLAFLTTEMPAVRTRMEKAESALTQYKLSNSGPDLTTETTLLLQQSVSVQQNILLLKQQRQDLLQRFTEDHPSVVALTAQIAQASSKQGELDRKLQKLPGSQRDLATLTRDMDINSALMTSLLNEMHQLEVAKSGASGVVRIVDRAAQPFTPTFPKPGIVLSAALIAGLIIGCFVASLLSAIRHRVEKVSEISEASAAPCLSVIPASRAQARLDRRGARSKTADGGKPLVLSAPDDVASEGFRWLRAALLTDSASGMGGSYLFTGLSAEVGRSFVLSNLASMLARSNLRVVVVDADLRSRSLRQHFPSATPRPGVAEWLKHSAGIEDIVVSSGPNLPDYIGAGQDGDALEKLTTGRLRVLFQQLDTHYDFVLVNAPDVSSFPDALIVAKAVSGVVLVCRQSAHEPEAVRYWADQLKRIDVPLIGTVLNRTQRSDRWGYIGAPA